MKIIRAETTTAVLDSLDSKIAEIVAEADAKKVRELKYEQALQANLKEVYDKHKEKTSGGGGGLGAFLGRKGTGGGMGLGGAFERDVMHMDVDEPLESSKGKNRKWVQPAGLSIEWKLNCGPRASQEANPKQQRKRNKF